MIVKIKFGKSSQTFGFLANVQTFPVFTTAGFYKCFFFSVEVGLVDDAGFIFILLRLVLNALRYEVVVHSLKGFCVFVDFIGGLEGRAKLMLLIKSLLLNFIHR